MTLEVKPEELHAYASMLGSAAEEAEEADTTMADNFAAARKDVAGVDAHSLLMNEYDNLSHAVGSFYSTTTGALNRAGEVLGSVADKYGEDDAQGADEVASAWFEEMGDKGNPEEERGASAGKTNHSPDEKAFEYVPYGMSNLAESAEENGNPAFNPAEEIIVPELEQYPEAVDFAATWGMNVNLLIAPFVGDWSKVDAASWTVQNMSDLNNTIAGNLTEHSARLAESWEGETSESFGEFMVWMADNIAGCENTLGAVSQAMDKYQEAITDLASGIGYGMGWFLWEADWAVWADCFKGPLPGDQVPTPSKEDALSGIDKAKFSEYLKSNPWDWEGKNFKSWANTANRYLAAAYAAMVVGLLQQFNSLLLQSYEVATYAEELAGPVASANTDLEQAAERLDAFRQW